MRVYVYAIAKNEEAFAKRWYESMKEADGVFVLDTGSTDGTVTALRTLGAVVNEAIIRPWRFDVARNESMKMIPDDADICVCTDLDEVFLKGWRKELETAWESGTTSARYEYVWSFCPDGGDGVKFLSEKIHAPGICQWVNPVHEVLAYSVPQRFVLADIRLEHHPDDTKSRSNYLPLLEMAVAENPENDRNTHYLGREYMYHGMWEKAIDTLEKHLSLKTATWKPERCASMRFIARSYRQLNEQSKAELWLSRAIAECPDMREPWLDMTRLQYDLARWTQAAYYGEGCTKILHRGLSYISEPEAWGSLPYDLLSIIYWHLGRQHEAVVNAKTALKFEPENERIRRNIEQMERYHV